jgi:hypothetical protein
MLQQFDHGFHCAPVAELVHKSTRSVREQSHPGDFPGINAVF